MFIWFLTHSVTNSLNLRIATAIQNGKESGFKILGSNNSFKELGILILEKLSTYCWMVELIKTLHFPISVSSIWNSRTYKTSFLSKTMYGYDQYLIKELYNYLPVGC